MRRQDFFTLTDICCLELCAAIMVAEVTRLAPQVHNSDQKSTIEYKRKSSELNCN